jgi:hypothetical protein
MGAIYHFPAQASKHRIEFLEDFIISSAMETVVMPKLKSRKPLLEFPRFPD